jgi:hypothetical protein
MSFGTIQIEKMTTESGYSLGAGNASSFKNRIINGAMVINQRGTGSSNAVVNGTCYVDQFVSYSSTASDYLVGQNLNSITPPTGFQNYLGIQSSIATSPASGDYHFTANKIEGYNWADLGWGSASAKSVTLSFWVRSSLTGTFGGAITNGAANRSYPFTYTISAANTWEQISVTIPGDTSGTWLTTNGIGVYVRFGYGTGSSRSGTANTWAAANYDSATGAVSVTATSGATWYVTGVQVEVGTVATSFDFRDYGTEFYMCQRYFQNLQYPSGGQIATGLTFATTSATVRLNLLQEMRATPSITLPTAGQTAGTISFLNNAGYPAATGTHSVSSVNSQGFQVTSTNYTGLAGGGYACWFYVSSAGSAVSFLVSAEL